MSKKYGITIYLNKVNYYIILIEVYKMNKISRLVTIVLIMMLVVGGVGFSSELGELYKLKLISGDGNSFNLDGQLKRSDAAAFIVKLLGKNEYVQKKKYLYTNVSFSDINKNDWYAPYIGYLTKKDIVNGFGDNTYKPYEDVSEKAFLKMALVALGYEYNEDFTWDNIYIKAFEIGLLEDISYTVKTDDTYDYTRGEVVEVLHKTLDKAIKDQNRTVVERLIDEEVVEKADVEELGLIKEDQVTTEISSLKLKSNTILEFKLNEKVTDYEIQIIDDADNAQEIVDITTDGKEFKVEVSALESDREYTLKISNLVDQEGFVVDLLKKDFDGPEEIVVESPYFEVSKIEVLNKREIMVSFTHPVDDTVKLPVYYSIKKDGIELIEGTSKNMKVSLVPGDDTSIKIWLMRDSFEKGQTYTLDINGELKSLYTVYLNKGEGQEVNFTGIDKVPEELRLEDIEVLNDDYIRLTFNKDLDSATALDNDNYSMDDLDSSGNDYNNAADVEFSGMGALEKRQIDVKFYNMDDNHTYELEIDDIKDIYEHTEIENYEESFRCKYDEDDEDTDVELAGAVVVNEKTIKVYFDETIDKSSENAIFSIDGESVYDVVFNEEKPHILTILLSSKFTENETEDIELIDGLYDKNKNLVDDIMILEDVEGSDNQMEDVKVESMEFISDDKIKIEFSRAINTSKSDNLSDYILEYEDEENDNYDISAEEVKFIYDNLAIVTFDMPKNGNDFELTIKDLYDRLNYETDEINMKISVSK